MHFSALQEVFISRTINVFIFFLEGGLENCEKEHKLREKSFCKTLFQLRIGLKKGQKQGGDERMHKDYPISAVHFFAVVG